MKKRLLFLVIIFAFFSPAYAAEEGLVAHYNFDENAGTILHDISGNGNNGVITGATWTNGINGSALKFDGVDDKVQISGSNLSPPVMTLEIWINANSTEYAINVLNKAPCAGQLTQLGYKIEFEYNSEIYAYIYKDGGDGWDYVNVGTPIKIENWYQLIFVSNYTELLLYVNGALLGSAPFTSNIRSTTQDIFLGSDSAGYCEPRHYKGLIDELKIYNRALTPEEIKQEYDKFTKPAGPVDSDGDGLTDANEIAYQLNPYAIDTDNDGLNDSVEYYLLVKYLPEFQYTADGLLTEFYPQPVEVFLNYSNVYNYSREFVRTGPISSQDVSAYGSEYYLDFNKNNIGGLPASIFTFKQLHDFIRPGHGTAIYMRAVPENYGKDYIVLQYWQHYLYNQFFNFHEGDWEMVEVLIDKETLEPEYAAYSKHDDSPFSNGGEIRRWNDVEKNGSRPIVYVAKGSHASYFERGDHRIFKWVKDITDKTSSEGLKLDIGAFNKTLILGDEVLPAQKWMLFGGRWGSVLTNDTDILRINGPTGPMYKGEKWDTPAAWGLKYLSRTILQDYLVAYSKGAALTAVDKYNRRVAFKNNAIIKEIPDSAVVSVIDKFFYILPYLPYFGNIVPLMAQDSAIAKTAAEKPSYVYLLEPNGTYEFDLYFANETEARHIVFYNVSGINGTKDRVWTKGNKIYMSTADKIKRLNVMLEYMNDTYETRTNLTDIMFTGNEILVIKIKDWTSLQEQCSGKVHIKEKHGEKQKQCKNVVKIKYHKKHLDKKAHHDKENDDLEERAAQENDE